MKTITATTKRVIRDTEQFYANEITSFEELARINTKQKLAIMHSGELLIGNIIYYEGGSISIWTGTESISVKPETFERKAGFLYEVFA